MDWDRATPLLNDKLDSKNVNPPKQYGPKGHYIEGWLAIAEANRIFGFGEWSYSLVNCTCVFQGPRAIGPAKKDGFGVTYTATIRVMVGDVIREDVGAGHGYDVDCGLAHESAIKEAVTDALKRALRSFGNPFGLALYDKSRENVGTPENDAKSGNDAPKVENRPANDQPPKTQNNRPDPVEVAVITLITQINGTTSLESLQKVWADNQKNAVITNDRVLKAKDERKAALSKPQPERWPGDTAQRPLVDDVIPY